MTNEYSKAPVALPNNHHEADLQDVDVKLHSASLEDNLEREEGIRLICSQLADRQLCRLAWPTEHQQLPGARAIVNTTTRR